MATHTMATSDAINELAAALAKAQVAFEEVRKSRTVDVKHKQGNGGHRYRYAELHVVLKAVRPALAANGLSVTSATTMTENNNVVCVTRLLHASGQWLEATWPVRGVGNQDLGSALSYARRYTITALLGVAQEDDDDDGQAAEEALREEEARRKQDRWQQQRGGNNNGRQQQQQRRQLPPPAQQQRQQQPPPPQRQQQRAPMATAKQVREFNELLARFEAVAPSDSGSPRDFYLARAGVSDFPELTMERMDNIVRHFAGQVAELEEAAAGRQQPQQQQQGE